MTFSSSSSIYSWSNLPLDLLISIKERIHERPDLLSFRSVCSQWRSSVPVPKHLQLYDVSIPSPFPSSYKLSYICASNGWLLFKNQNYSYHLFDPISLQKHSLPHLTRKKIRGKFKRWTGSMIQLFNVAVSLRPDGFVIVVGIANVCNRRGTFIYEKFAYYIIGKDKCWNISKETNDGILKIIGGREGKRFYAIDEEWGLYVLEVGPLMRSKRFNLFLPEHILCNNHADKSKGEKKQFLVQVEGIREKSGEYLKIYGHCYKKLLLDGECWLVLKLKALELCIDSTDVNAYYHIHKWKAKCRYDNEFCYHNGRMFMPKL
ncbi:putative F-box protein [Platanthera zijinensis]|uniref:F-box protein n=1 Tax=Platanthera zijinensis TaxID=2320716 RepID=A0AAP0AV61_9ASPA